MSGLSDAIPARLASAAPSGRVLSALAGGAALLGGVALANTLAARRAEATHPPRGHVIEVDGTHVHMIEGGPGRANRPPVVLLHGNLVTAGDWLASGVFARLVASGHRVVAFDRPGFGHSERPRGMRWGASEQAALLRRACALEGIERPIVVGHSWASLVALAWALDAPASLSGVVLLGGYYYPTNRVDAAFVAPAAMPVIGDLLTHTVSPPVTRASLPAVLKGMFAPAPVPDDYGADVPPGLVARPSQQRATAEEGATMVDEAAQLIERVDTLRVPVGIMAGRRDKVVDPAVQSVRLAARLARDPSRAIDLAVEPDAGHMVHHVVPDRVAAMISTVGAERSRAPLAARTA